MTVGHAHTGRACMKVAIRFVADETPKILESVAALTCSEGAHAMQTTCSKGIGVTHTSQSIPQFLVVRTAPISLVGLHLRCFANPSA